MFKRKLIVAMGIAFLLSINGVVYADKREVKVLEWSEADKVVTRDDYAKDLNNAFTVYDIQTNRSFKMIRTGGQNHADVEPLTKGDTAVYKDIFGGEWTWTPRPVVIEIGGTLYGASLDAMPHAGYDDKDARIHLDKSPGGKGREDYTDTYNYDSVKGNDFDGHANLHFKGSVTHSGEETKHPDTIVKMIELVKDGYDTSGAISGGVSDNDNGSNSEILNNDSNVENTVGGAISTSTDDFVTGKLVTGSYKLPKFEGSKIDIKEGAPPNGSYYFTADGVLVGPAKGGGADTSSLSISVNLFNNILQGKERAVVKEMQDLQKKEFATTEISGDLSGTQNYWTYDLSKLYSNSFASNFTISNGKTTYTIYIPRGVDEEGNQINGRIIGATIRSIELYKKAVLQGMYGGMVVTSYNLFSMYPTSQLPMTDVIDITKIDKNNIRPLKSSTRMKYSLDYYYHPVLGKISADDLVEGDTEWGKKWSNIQYDASSGGGKIQFNLNDEYREFMNGTDPARQGAMQMKNAILSKSNGMKGYTLNHTHDKAEPASLVGTLFRVAIPKHFERSLGSSKYIIKEDRGYEILEDVRLSITLARVFVGKEDDLKVAGDYVNYGIEEKGLAFYKTVVDGKIVGAVVPLWYNEAVYDPYEDKLYYTGRPIKFDNDYIGKIEFMKPNVELFAAEEKAGGNRKITIREFAFGDDKDYLKYEDHENIGNLPDSFDINVTFEGHKTGKPADNFSANGGAEAGVEDENSNEGTEGSGDTDTTASIGVTKNVANVCTIKRLPLLYENVYADIEGEESDYYDDIVVTDDYDPIGVPEEGEVGIFARLNPLSRANTGANASDASKDWGHGITIKDLQKLSKGKYKGKEELIIKVANVYKVNPALMLSIMMVENGGDSPLLNRANNCGSNAWWDGCGFGKDATNPRWISFPTLDDGINYLGAYLSRVHMSKGNKALDVIGKSYCPPTYKDWASKVNKNFKTITGRDWDSSKDPGEGIKSILQIDVKEIDKNAGSSSNNSSSTSSESTDNSGSETDNGAVTVESTEVFNGFTIVRNNVYLQEPGLISWLGSKEARALVNVDSDTLLKKIQGDSDMSNQMLTYKDWERMQEIRGELGTAKSLNALILRLTRLVTMIFGFILIFYSILLVFAYYIDVFNVLPDLSILSLMTFGRYYSVSSKEEIEYLGPPDEGQKYVTIIQLSFIVFTGLFVGGMFVLATPILRLIATMYLKIKGVTGGI